MKNNRKTLMYTSIVIMMAIWGFIAIEKGTDLFKGLDLYIFIFIVVLGTIAFVRALKRDKEEKEGLPAEDELSNLIKYKTGYLAYMTSMYMWLFIFIFKDKFPNVESMLGGGILLSALIFFITKVSIKKKFNEK